MAAKRIAVESIGSYFASLTDPRGTRNRKHLFRDIVVIAVCGVVCGCDGPTAIRRWAVARAEWFNGFLELPNGIPSRDCIRNLLMAVQPEAFQRCFRDGVAGALVTEDGNPNRLVKDNQPKLAAAIAAIVEKHLEGELKGLEDRNHRTDTRGHGRRDERFYWVAQVPPDLAAKDEWPWIKALGTAVRITTHADGSTTDEVRYDMLSRFLSGTRFGQAVRGHRGIEAMHWVLDVTFGEDQTRTRQRILANNLSWLRRFAITLLKRHPEKDSIRGRMVRCLMDTAFLDQVLTLQGN